MSETLCGCGHPAIYHQTPNTACSAVLQRYPTSEICNCNRWQIEQTEIPLCVVVDVDPSIADPELGMCGRPAITAIGLSSGVFTVAVALCEKHTNLYDAHNAVQSVG